MPTQTGTSGNDFLEGTAGADTLIGLAGDDVYIVDNINDDVVEAAGEGNDTVYAAVSYQLHAGSYIETLAARDNGQTTPLNLIGNEFVNFILGNAGANFIDGGVGADIMTGFGGDDIYAIDDQNDIVIEDVGGGNDTVYTTLSYQLRVGTSTENLGARDNSLTTALSLVGNEFNNSITGNSGANFIDGAQGADIMTGFGGDDTYCIDDQNDIVIEDASGGNDTVFTTISYQLRVGTYTENLGARDNSLTTALSLVGNEFNNSITGNSGANFIDGAQGADIMTGFGGDDTYCIDDQNDIVIEGVGGGNDTVFTTISYQLRVGTSTENLAARDNSLTVPLSLVGNEVANTIFGNNGANFIDGAQGADIMIGFAGDDTYIVDDALDQVSEGASGGNDTVFSSVSYALAASMSVETLSSRDINLTTALNLTGNELANALVGNNGVNTLDGKDGNDTLRGFGGADNFAFTTALGAGNVDTIIDFQTGSDKVLLAGAAGLSFAALAAGSLRAGTLVIGTAAIDADDYLIYNSATGALLYDADGVGGAAAVQFATLATGLSLTVADFTVSGAANNAPSITSGATASVAENSNASTIVYQTAATDADGDRITYSLSGTDASLLSIDANGAVRLIASADFETKNSYVFNVIASDSGAATAKAVTLTVTDVQEAATPIINETQGSNDTQQTAQSLDPNSFVVAPNPNLVNAAYPSAEIHGSISTPTDTGGVSNDVDYYSITLTAGQQLILDVDINPANGLDSFLSLYGPDGVLIGDQDDLISADPGSGTQFGHNTDSQIIFRAATGGTYYFSIKSFADNGQATSKGDYTLNVSVNSTPATAAQIMAEDVQALASGTSWNHNGPAFNLTYGFPSLASYYPSTFDEVAPGKTFTAFSAVQQDATRSLLQLVANVTQITFTENTAQGQYNVAGTAANANIRYARSSEVDPGAAYAYLPTNGGPSSVGGSAWFNISSQNANFNNPVRGNYAWMGILHETGHALGLKHGHEFPLAISADHDSVEYSVMTYRSYPGASTTGGYSNETYGYAQTLMMLDIAALQKIYGSANYAFNAGTSVYSWSPTTGEMSINGVGQGAPGTGLGGTSNRVFMTIWDGGGNDTYDLSNYNSGTTIDLRPGEWTTTSSQQLANLGQSHLARGNVANALLFEGNLNSAIENAIGGIANDTLIANQVSNQLTGNGGIDTFKWMATGDAGTGGSADTVTDFSRGFDKIDFTNLDANPATAAHNAFSFIGTSAFHNVAGEVRYDVTGGNAHIFADVDGNGTADMEIVLTNVATLAATDFNF